MYTYFETADRIKQLRNNSTIFLTALELLAGNKTVLFVFNGK